jgi:hypothetical protein
MEPMQVVGLAILVAVITAAATWWLCHTRDMSSSYDARIVGYSLWKWNQKDNKWVSVDDKPKAGYVAPPPPSPSSPTAIPEGFVVRVLAKK